MARSTVPFGVQDDQNWLVFGQLLYVDRQSLPEKSRLLVRIDHPSVGYDPGLVLVIEVPLVHLQRSSSVIADLERCQQMITGFYVKRVRGDDAVQRLVLCHHNELGVQK